MAEKAETEINVPFEDLGGLKFINRVWRVLFGCFGLQLDILDGGSNSKSWAKIVCAGITRCVHAISILHFFLVFISYQYERPFALISLSSSQIISLYTAIVCLKREKKIKAAYRKIMFNFFTARDLLKKFDRSTKLYFILVMVTTTTLSINYILLETNGGRIQEIYRTSHARIGIHNDYFTTITTMLDYCVILVFSHLFMDVMFIYLAHLCEGLALNFVLFNRCLEAELRATSLTPSKLNILRHRYEYITSLVDDISHLFSPLILLWIASLVSNLCFDIRAVKTVISSNSVLNYSRYVLMIFRGIIYLLLILRTACQINKQAHLMNRKAFTKVMDECPDRTMNEAFYTNYLLFSQVINSCNTGISVSGLFTLNVSSVLTIAGTVLTYTIILFQTG